MAATDPTRFDARRRSVISFDKTGSAVLCEVESPQQQQTATKTFDDILFDINPRGLWQTLTLLQCVLSYVAVGLSSYGQAIFVAGRMDATCVRYSDGNDPSYHYDVWLSKQNHEHDRENGTILYNVTELFRLLEPTAFIQANLSSLSSNKESVCPLWLAKHQCRAPHEQGGAKCVQWKYTSPYYTSTMQSEWNLVCDDAYKVPLFQASYQIGYMFGMPVVGNLADWLGRRGVVWLAWPFLVAGYATLSQAPFFWVAAIVRFIQGTLFGSYWNAKLILNMEMTVPEKRNLVSVAVNCSWPVAAIIISIVAYYVRNWRMLQLICIAPVLAILPCILLLPESPRWLIMRGKLKRAVRTLKRGARINRRAGPSWADLSFAVQSAKTTATKSGRDTPENSECEEVQNSSKATHSVTSHNPFRGMVIFFTERQLRRHSLLLFVLWFVTAMVFYGIMFYGTGVLPGSPHLKFGLMSISRLLACPLQLLIFNRFGAKRSLVVLLMLAAASLLTIGLLSPKTPCVPESLATVSVSDDSFWSSLLPAGTMSAKTVLTIVFLMIGNCLIDACFAAVYIVTGEIYPIEVRQTGFSLCSTLAGVGSAISPFAADMFGLLWRPLPAFVFAGACAVASFAAWMLPRESTDKSEREEVSESSISTITSGLQLALKSTGNIMRSVSNIDTESRVSVKRQMSRQTSTTASNSRYNVILGEAMCGGTLNPIVSVGGNLSPSDNLSTFDGKARKWQSLRILDHSTSTPATAHNKSNLLRRFSARLTKRKPDIQTMRAAAAAKRAANKIAVTRSQSGLHSIEERATSKLSSSSSFSSASEQTMGSKVSTATEATEFSSEDLENQNSGQTSQRTSEK